MNQDKGKACASTTPAEVSGGAWEVPGYVVVMTDEQVEVLRKQISIYATICEQLLEMHHALTAHQGSIAGVRSGGNLYRDTPTVHGDKKFTARQRWQPTQMQLHILESIFGQGNGALPGRQKIQDITAELSQHGQVAETNVYNWFQNRRARAKRNLKRKQAASPQHNAESEAQARSSSS